MQVRILSEEERKAKEQYALERVKGLREELLQESPLYGLVALQRTLSTTWQLSTAGTDGKEVTWNPLFVESLSAAEVKALFCHEFWHVLKCDHLRIEEVYKKYPHLSKEILWKLYNIASDMVINLLVREEGWRMPEGSILDRTAKGKDTEEVLAELIERMEEETKYRRERQGQGEGEGIPGEGEQGEGEEGSEEGEEEETQASDNVSSDDKGKGVSAGEGDEQGDEGGEKEGEGEGSIDEDLIDEEFKKRKGIDVMEPKNEDGSDMTQSEKEQEKEEKYREIRQALNAAGKAGKVTANTKVKIDKEMKPTKTAREVLTRFLQDAISRSDYTFKRPNKRYIDAGFYLPTLQEESYHKIAAIIDVSSSVSDSMVRDFCIEMREYLEGIGTDAELLVMYVSDVFCGHDVLKRDDSFDLHPTRKSYGTDFIPGFRWLKEQGEDRLNGLVYYTDGHCHSFPSMDLEPPCPVMWILHHQYHVNPERFTEQVPFGEVLVMPKKGE